MTAEAAKSDDDKKTGEENVTKPSLNMDELRELADLIEERGITEFEFENELIRVRMSKQAAAPIMQQQMVPIAQSPAAPVAPSSEIASGSAESAKGSEEEDLYVITSPIVGTYYSAPGPDKEPYVKVGDSVSNEMVVCIIEAMKLMNEIQAEISGEVVKIYVENAQPVEYGQPLFGIKQ